MDKPLTHHQNLEIEDILDKLHSVTQESDPSGLQYADQNGFEEN